MAFSSSNGGHGGVTYRLTLAGRNFLLDARVSWAALPGIEYSMISVCAVTFVPMRPREPPCLALDGPSCHHAIMPSWRVGVLGKERGKTCGTCFLREKKRSLSSGWSSVGTSAGFC